MGGFMSRSTTFHASRAASWAATLLLTAAVSILAAVCLTAAVPDARAAGLSREEAVTLATQVLPGGTTDGVRLYVAPDPVAPGETIASAKHPVFTAPSAGWFLFVDRVPMANWEHPCWYIFVDARSGELSRYDAMVPPAQLTELVEITHGRDNPLPGEAERVRAWLDAGIRERKRVEASRHGSGGPSAGETGAAPAGDGGTRGLAYALIISGGADAGNNHIRYWNDCSFIYTTLVNYYGYPDENIYVCISDGLNPAPDRSNGTNSPPDLDGDGDDDIQYPATMQYISQVFAELATILTPHDQLFIFTTDHGGQESGWDCYLNLWNWEEMRDDQLAAFIDALPCETVLCCFEQCFSGGMIDDLEGEGRVIATAARWDEYSWAMSGLVYDEFVYDWISAVNWEDPYGASVDADTNNDDMVSMEEAFIYARDHDVASEHPQYSSTPLELGQTASLMGAFEGVYLQVDDILIDDDNNGASQGNGNGVIEPNETIELRVALHNAGRQDGESVMGTLTTSSPYIAPIAMNASYGIIPSGATVLPLQPFVFHVTPDVPDLEDLGLVLEVTEEPLLLELGVTARAVRFTGEITLVDDELGGNGDGTFDPGEDVVLTLAIGNAGGIASPPVSCWLGSGSLYFTTDPTPRALGVLDPGEVRQQGGFEVSISPQCPPLYSGCLHLHFEGPGLYEAMVLIPVVMGQILVADMESGATGWTHYAATGWQDRWHLETYRNHTEGGTRSWKFGGTGSAPYANHSHGMLETPEFDLPGGSDLTFWHWMNVQTSESGGRCYDGGLLQISTDGGATWEQLTPEGGYPYTIIQQGPVGPGPFPDWTPVWSGQHDWEEVHVDLGPYSGPARLRWVFGSDGSTIYEGWYVDDIEVMNVMPMAGASEDEPLVIRPVLFPVRPNPAIAASVSGAASGGSGAGLGGAGAVTLDFALPRAADIRLALFDPAGRLVRELAAGAFAAGQHRIAWDGRDAGGAPVAAGSYYCRLQTGEGGQTRVLTVVR
jgi:hypothetical protein